jgi:hypothetical protein
MKLQTYLTVQNGEWYNLLDVVAEFHGMTRETYETTYNVHEEFVYSKKPRNVNLTPP